MERIALIIGERFLYWSPLILAIAVFAAVCAFISLHLYSGGNVVGTFLVIPVAIVLSVLLGRLLHWYCRPDVYESFSSAMGDLLRGGFALTGVFIGCILAVCLMRGCKLLDDLPKALDCLALAGALGIAVGRLNHLYNDHDRGQVLEGITAFPVVYPVENAATGLPEYRFATFMAQALVAAILFAALTVFYLGSLRSKKLHSGDTCLLFCLCYGLSQVLLDSTRYDSLFFRSNGFVSMVQILGAVIAVIPVVLFSVRLVRSKGWHPGYLGFWGGVLVLLTAAGVMEYYVQRMGNRAAIFHSVMGVCLIGVIAITLVMRCMAVRQENTSSQKDKEEEQTS